MAEYVNAAPMVDDKGIRDNSTRERPPVPVQIPQHLPLFYIRAEKGPVGRFYVDHINQNIERIYGAETFKKGSKYFNHQTRFLAEAVKANNNCVIHRLVGKDAKDVANLTLYLDVLEDNVPLYKKDVNGDLEYDQEGNPVYELDSDGTAKMVPGYSCLWVVDHQELPLGDYVIGRSKERTGIQSGTKGKSKQYPIIEMAGADVGQAANRIAGIFSALTHVDKRAFPSEILEEGKMYPYAFSMSLLLDEMTGEEKQLLNYFGNETVTFVLKDGGVHPLTKGIIDLRTMVRSHYIDVPLQFKSGLGDIHVYTDYYSKVTKMFYEAESAQVDEWTDNAINPDEENYDAINIFSFVNSNGSPYQTLKLIDDVGSVRLTRNTKQYLAGGDDGSITDEEFELMVSEDITKYGDLLHEYQNLVKHPESIFYDTGFSVETKLKLGNFISNRKDTFLMLTPFIHNKPLTIEDEYALSVTLDNMLSLYPESTVYGTKVVRGLILGSAGQVIGSTNRDYVPTLFSVFKKAAAYMGDRSGNWVAGKLFDHAPGSVIDDLENITIDWVPANARNRLWDANLNFPLTFSVRSHFLPALKTVCKDDTSVLNSFFVVMACCYLNKIGHAAWRQFSGAISLTDGQLCKRVNEFISTEAHNRFDNLFVVVPETVVTERDEINGFSWTTAIKLYANNMKTVMSLTIETYRFSDFEGQ